MEGQYANLNGKHLDTQTM